MPVINEGAKLEIQCPKCRAKFSKTIRELKGSGVKCPACGIQFETSQFKKALDKVDRSLKDLGHGLKNIKINIKL
jgi:peptide subunit release factor 1 (eRF1)